MDEQPARKTRSQRRAERRERRVTALAKARRQDALRRRSEMTADRFADIKANPFDVAWKISS